MEIWEPKPPGTLWATTSLLRDSFTFTFFFIVQKLIQCKQQQNLFLLNSERV